MVKVIGKNKEYNVEPGADMKGASIEVAEDGIFYFLQGDNKQRLELVEANYTEKTFSVRVNGQLYSFTVEDKFDALLKEMGMESLTESTVEDLKAPMPGLVLDIAVSVGDQIKKGDALLVLEAMKMENSIKASTEGTVSEILIEKGQAVEKNQILIAFE